MLTFWLIVVSMLSCTYLLVLTEGDPKPTVVNRVALALAFPLLVPFLWLVELMAGIITLSETWVFFKNAASQSWSFVAYGGWPPEGDGE